MPDFSSTDGTRPFDLSERYRLLADQLRDVVWTMNPQGEITYVSPAVEALRGFTQAEACAQPVHEILTPGSAQVVGDYFAGMLQAVAAAQVPPDFRGQLEYYRKDGSTFWTEVFAFPLLDPQGRLIEVLGLTRDISARKQHESVLEQAREQADRANAAKSEFLAHISHEIRTPMAALLSYVELSLGSPLQPEQREWLLKAQDAGRTLMRILGDVLDLSRIEAGQLVLQPCDVDLLLLLDQLRDMVAQRCLVKGLAFHLVLAPQVPVRLHVDGQRLQQILLNLVGNAIRFTERGQVTVEVGSSTAAHGEAVLQVQVRDTGPGISALDQERIFERFVQAPQPGSQAQGGTGLGLAICRQLVQHMGGRIGVESSPGQGACFWFTLPLVPAQAQPPVASARDQASPDALLRGQRILVAEDEPMLRETLSRLLTSRGMQVHVAEDGLMAWQLLQQVPVDLVLMDVRMPRMDGLALARAIRQQPQLDHLRLVGLTAGGFLDDRNRCLEAGMNAYLHKPFEFAELLQTLSEQLGLAVHAA